MLHQTAERSEAIVRFGPSDHIDAWVAARPHDKVITWPRLETSRVCNLPLVVLEIGPLPAFGCIDFSVEAFWRTRIGQSDRSSEAGSLTRVGLSNRSAEIM
jgi:hypothetical protein